MKRLLIALLLVSNGLLAQDTTNAIVNPDSLWYQISRTDVPWIVSASMHLNHSSPIGGFRTGRGPDHIASNAEGSAGNIGFSIDLQGYLKGKWGLGANLRLQTISRDDQSAFAQLGDRYPGYFQVEDGFPNNQTLVSVSGYLLHRYRVGRFNFIPMAGLGYGWHQGNDAWVFYKQDGGHQFAEERLIHEGSSSGLVYSGGIDVRVSLLRFFGFTARGIYHYFPASGEFDQITSENAITIESQTNNIRYNANSIALELGCFVNY